jgi:hypothetical protein
MYTDDPKYTRRALAWTIGLGLFAALYRQAPYRPPLEGTNLVWHLMPVGALSLFAGSRLRSRWAFLVPVAAMLLSDLLLIAPLAARGMSAFSWGTPLIYASFLLSVVIGRCVQRDESSPWVIGGAALLGSLGFFVLSNFSVWAFGHGHRYPFTFAGLIDCYVAAIPFFRNTVASDLAFGFAFFALHGLSESALARRGALAGRQAA